MRCSWRYAITWAFFPRIRCSTFSISDELNRCLKCVCDSVSEECFISWCVSFPGRSVSFPDRNVSSPPQSTVYVLDASEIWDSVSLVFMNLLFYSHSLFLSTYLLNQSKYYSGWNNWEAQRAFFLGEFNPEVTKVTYRRSLSSGYDTSFLYGRPRF